MIKGIEEIHSTELYRRIVQGLSALADRQDDRTTTAARREPIEDVRYNAGVADGIRQAISALEPRRNSAEG